MWLKDTTCRIFASSAEAASENHCPPGFFVITRTEKPVMLQIAGNLLLLEIISFFITCYKSKWNAYWWHQTDGLEDRLFILLRGLLHQRQILGQFSFPLQQISLGQKQLFWKGWNVFIFSSIHFWISLQKLPTNVLISGRLILYMLLLPFEQRP